MTTVSSSILSTLVEVPQSQGKPKSFQNDDKKVDPVHRKVNGMDEGQEILKAKCEIGDKMSGDTLF